MKVQKAECPMCGEEFQYLDVKNKPTTCGRKECVTNYQYMQKRFNPRTGEMPDPEEIKKWKK